MMRVALLTFTLLHLAAATRVLELSDKFLPLEHEGSWLLMFYAPWCGHCKKLEPVFQLVAQSLHPYRDFLHVGKIDCTRFSSVASHFEIKGYPTIIFLKEGRRFFYEGDRTRDELVAFVDRLVGPAVKRADDINEVINKREVVFFYVLENDENNNNDDKKVEEKTSLLMRAFEEVAASNQKEDFFYKLTIAQAKKLWPQAKEGSVFVYKDKEATVFTTEEQVKDTSESKSDADSSALLKPSLASFVQRERFPRFMKLTLGKLSKALSSSRYLVLAVLEEDILGELETDAMVEFRSFLSSFSQLATTKQELSSSFQFGWTGTPSLANSIAMETLELPALLVINGSTLQHHIPDDEPRQLTHEALHIFLTDVKHGVANVYGGNTYGVRVYRSLYEVKSSLLSMWKGNPVLTAVLLGLPMGFFALICYSICCADIMDAEDDEDEEEQEPHQKTE